MREKTADPGSTPKLYVFFPQARLTFLLSRWWHKHVCCDLAARLFHGREKKGKPYVQYVDTAKAEGNVTSATDKQM